MQVCVTTNQNETFSEVFITKKKVRVVSKILRKLILRQYFWSFLEIKFEMFIYIFCQWPNNLNLISIPQFVHLGLH